MKKGRIRKLYSQVEGLKSGRFITHGEHLWWKDDERKEQQWQNNVKEIDDIGDIH